MKRVGTLATEKIYVDADHAQFFAIVDYHSHRAKIVIVDLKWEENRAHASWSKTIRTARARTSGENLFVVLLITAPPSQELEPPTIPVPFKPPMLFPANSAQEIDSIGISCGAPFCIGRLEADWGQSMTARMAKLDRAIALVHMLCESAEGLALDEMAERLGVNRRTVERLHDVIMLHFDLEDVVEGRTKRFRIRESLRRVYSRPSAEEIAALQAECEAPGREGATQAALLANLLTKVRGWLDQREKSCLDPDLDALARLQRSRLTAGPAVGSCDAVMTLVQQAIMIGVSVERGKAGKS